MSTNDTRKSQLLALKLRALVRDHRGRDASDDSLRPAVFARGAAVLDHTLSDATVAWVFVDEQPTRGLGPALLWALKENCAQLNVLAESGTGVIARRAAELNFPIAVWHVDERSLIPAVAEPFVEPATVDPQHASFLSLIAEGGATPLIEHGIVTGEVLGLEVCRAVNDPVTGAARLEVGMGAHDREAFALLHGDKPTVSALADVVDNVKLHRRPGALAHPFNRIAPERLLRCLALDSPALVNTDVLEPCDPPVARTNVLDIVPCVARGKSSGSAAFDTVVVFTSGADPDIVPFALDARAYVDQVHGTSSSLVIAMPESHVTPTNRRALELARRGAKFVAISPPIAPPS